MVKRVSQIRKLVLALALTDLLWLGWLLAHIVYQMAQKSLLFGDLPGVHPQDLWKTSAGDRSIPCVTWNSSGYMELQKVRTDTP